MLHALSALSASFPTISRDPVGVSPHEGCGEALPSKRPSSPDDSLEMVEWLQRHIKHQSSFSSKPVRITSAAPQGDIRTHSWSSHEDSGDHNLRNGLLRRFGRLAQPVVVLIRYRNPMLEFSENKGRNTLIYPGVVLFKLTH